MSARTTMLRTTVLAFVLVSAVGLLPLPAQAGGGCYGGPVADAKGTAVSLREMCFNPTVIRVVPGQKVTWTNRDSVEHTVTGVAFSWGSDHALRPGTSETFRFARAGIYVYACLFHPGMVGAVVVGNGGVPAVSGTSSGGDSSAVALVASPISKPKPPAAAAATVKSSSPGAWKGIALAAVALLVLTAAALALQRGRVLKAGAAQRAEA